ncbi:MAG: formate dehydrogenase accessory sulfurtransferase FdhD [Rubrivivax sp.]
MNACACTGTREPPPVADAHPPAEALAPLRSVAVRRWTSGSDAEALDWVCEEQPVSLQYDGIAHAVMMATPQDLEDFAVGFSLSEGIVDDRTELLDLDVEPHARGHVVSMRLTARRRAALDGRRRLLAGRSGCGLCGVDSLERLDLRSRPVRARRGFDPARLAAAMVQLGRAQPLRELTGATHGAAWLSADGADGAEIVAPREDVGRHNALDKTIGALVRQGLDPAGGALLVTSRASYELVLKSAAAGAGVLAAMSAPTALAIRSAHELGLTLVGFARGASLVVYTHGWRLQAAPAAQGARS